MNKDFLLNEPDIVKYIKAADDNLSAMKFTEHNVAHVTRVAHMACKLLSDLDYDSHIIDLAEIAGYLHDIGNIINRQGHAHHGAILAYNILKEKDYKLEDIFTIMSAIGNHDETSGIPVNEVSAALILADKADIRRSRVRQLDLNEFDIHDKVNYSVTSSNLSVDKENKLISLNLTLDTKYSSVIDYFSIFSSRMVLCRKAAEYLDMNFCLNINNITLMD